MAGRYGILGWRQPRANDFEGPDQRPIKDTFASVQQFMTWPHFTADIDGGQAAGGGYAKRTITATDDPYSLIRSNDDIQVPRDFSAWWFFGFAHATVPTAGAGLYQIGFSLGTSDPSHMIQDQYSTGPVALQRFFIFTMLPMLKGQILQIKTNTPAAVDITGGYVSGLFLPMA